MKLIQITFITAIGLLGFFFFFLPHTIELSGTLDTWFSYKGLIFYKDFNSFHFPIGRFILMPIHLLSNWNLELDPFVGLGIGVGNLIVIYYFGKKYLSEIATAFALFFFAIFFWFFATAILYFHEMLIGLLLTISVLLLFQLIKDNHVSAGKIFSLGLVLSLAEASGQIASPTVFAGVLITFYLLFRKKSNLLKNTSFLFIGLALPFTILGLYFLGKGALWEFIYWNTFYYFTYSTSVSPLSELPKKEILAFYLPLIISLISLLYKLKARIRISLETMVVFVLTASSLPFIIYSIFHPHHLNYPLGVLALAAGFSVDSLKVIRNGNVVIIIFSIIFISLGASTFIPWYAERLSTPSLKITNDVYPGDPMYDAIVWVKQNTSSSDKLMVVGDPLFYMRADRLPASRPIKSIIVSWEPIEEISKEITATPPNYWIVDTSSIKNLVTIYRKQNMVDFINNELKSEYSKKTTYDNWEIWERK